MKSTFALISLLGVAACAESQEPSNFTFRSMVAGISTEANEGGDCQQTKNPAELYCVEENIDVAGEAVERISSGYYQGRLVSVVGTMPIRSYFPIQQAFKQKYGEPCEEGKQGGGTRLVWCFKTGRMVLSEVGLSGRESSFVYADNWQPPKPAPKVDF